jgi:hypothetical protein
MIRLLILVCLVLVPASIEAEENTIVHADSVYLLRGTREYDREVDGAKLSLEEATARARESLRLNRKLDEEKFESMLGRGDLFVKGAYVFQEPPKQKNHFPLSGIHVDSNSGHVWMDITYESVGSNEIPASWRKLWIDLARQRQKERSSESATDGTENLGENTKQELPVSDDPFNSSSKK